MQRNKALKGTIGQLAKTFIGGILFVLVTMAIAATQVLTGATSYSFTQDKSPEALFADSTDDKPAVMWRKNRHGEPNDRTITLQLRSLDECLTKPVTYSTMTQGRRWETLTIKLDYPSGDPAANKCGDGKTWSWQQWTIHRGSQADDSLLPLDDVTALYLDYGDGKPVEVPQYKTQMDKLDDGYQQ